MADADGDKRQLGEILQDLVNLNNIEELLQGVSLLQSGARGVFKSPQKLEKHIADLQKLCSHITKSQYFSELSALLALEKEGYDITNAEVVLPAYNDENYVEERNHARFAKDVPGIIPYLEKVLQREGLLFFAGKTRVLMQTQYGCSSLFKPNLLIAGHPRGEGHWPDFLPALWVYSPRDTTEERGDYGPGVRNFISVPLSSAKVHISGDEYTIMRPSWIEMYIHQKVSATRESREPEIVAVSREEFLKLREGNENVILNKATLINFQQPQGRLYYLPHAGWEACNGYITHQNV